MAKKKEDNPFLALARKAHKLLKGKTVPSLVGKGITKVAKSAFKPKTKTKTKDTVRTKGITAQLRKSLTEKEIAKLRGK